MKFLKIAFIGSAFLGAQQLQACSYDQPNKLVKIVNKSGQKVSVYRNNDFSVDIQPNGSRDFDAVLRMDAIFINVNNVANGLYGVYEPQSGHAWLYNTHSFSKSLGESVGCNTRIQINIDKDGTIHPRIPKPGNVQDGGMVVMDPNGNIL